MTQKKYIARRWVACPVEAEYVDDRKAEKQKRKIASATDRSKYKKTDRNKRRAPAPMDRDKFLRGRVLSILSEGIVVEYEGKNVICSLRGVLKKEKGRVKNLVTVGDFVLFEKSTESEGFISHVETRRTLLSRADNLSRRKEQIIAANIDQVLITGSVVSPLLKPSLIDRYIIAARKGGLTPIIVLNKIDLLEDPSVADAIRLEEKNLFNHLLKAYKPSGIPLIPISMITGEGLEELRRLMKDRASVFAGQSGVGKSSLINAIAGLQLKVGDMVERTQKGSHTTTMAQLLPLPFGGWCIDTPGIKSFGLWDLQKNEIEQYFTEIHSYGQSCHFPNCTHDQEQGCAVRKAVEKGKISPVRYQSYLSLILSADQEHLRR